MLSNILNVLRNPSEFISATTTLVSILFWAVVALLVYRIWQTLTGSKRIALWAFAATIVFGLTDCILLAILPRLGLSFGPVGPPFLLITGFRSLLSILLIWTWKRLEKRWKKLASIRGSSLCCVFLWLGNLVILACEIDGLYFEPFKLQVTTLSFTVPIGLPENHLRIVQLSDLHVERTTKRELEVVEKVKALRPDIIFLTGDYLNTSYTNDTIARRDARWLFEQLHAHYGIYAITARGVDPPDAISDIFDGLNIKVLQDEVRKIGSGEDTLYVVGVSYLERRRDMKALTKIMNQLPDNAYTILLYHTPDILEIAAKEKVDLYMAGHTHGGQIRLPLFGAIVTASAYWKKYEQGLYEIDKTKMYVSRGIGMEGKGAPRARFLCPPEIVIVDMKSIDTDN
jgi:predicted MPP superfamily phosphohydrolase